MQQILRYHQHVPEIAKTAFIAPGALIIGEVKIGAYSGIWFNTVVRGDVAHITIGEHTNVQDGSVIHVSRNGGRTIIGSRVTIGHKALLHACTIHDDSFVGMGATMLDNSVIEPFAMLAAGSLLTGGKVVRSGEIWAGNPAKFFRHLSEDEKRHIGVSAENYVQHAIEYQAMQGNALG